MSSLYNIASSRMLNGFTWGGSATHLQLVTSGYVFDAAHTTLADDVSALYRVGLPATLQNMCLSIDGYACASGVKFTALTGSTVAAAVLYDGTSLIAYFDDVFELPYIPTGRDFYFLPYAGAQGTIATTGGWFRP